MVLLPHLFSGGTSLILLSPTVAAAMASTAQCGISLGRIFNLRSGRRYAHAGID
jgi:hypothetical protein